MFQAPGVPPAFVAGLVAMDVLTTGVAVVSYLSLHKASGAARALDGTYLPAIRTLKRLQRDLSETRVLARGIFMHGVAGRPDRMAAARDELRDAITTTRGHIAAYQSQTLTAAELEPWAAFMRTWETWRLLLDDYVEKLEARDTTAAYELALGPSCECMTLMNDALQQCIDLNFAYADEVDDRAAASCRFADITVGLASATSVVLAVGIALVSGIGPGSFGLLVDRFTAVLP